MTKPPLILASASPRRRELLKQLGRPFRVIEPDVDESVPRGLSPADVAEMLAAKKAEAVAATLAEGIVIGADTLVAAGGEIFGKPRDRADAIAILDRLTARPHVVITGLCLINARTGRRIVKSNQTTVHMRHMTRAEIEAYVASGEAMGKAGAYAIQETGDRFVTRLDGSLTNVVGLPMELLARMLKEMESTR